MNAKNLSLKIGDTDMDYIRFGSGRTPLVMLPGLGDSLRTVKGMALTFSVMYKCFARDFTVYVFSRKNRIDKGFSVTDMADDQAEAMNSLGITNACVMGISQGGMISMRLAAKYPELVKKLILANTAAGCNSTVHEAVGGWIRMAQDNDYKSLFIDTAEKTYSEKKLRTYRPMYPLLCAATRPKSLERFLIQADACLTHDASAELYKITCPTLVIGGGQDKIVGTEAARELADGIKGSIIKEYPELGHGAYEEASDFNDTVLDFLLNGGINA